MLIDWFTVIAQIINFLILVWLLKRFLYRPILAAMDSRQHQIDSNMRSAEEQRLAAEAERADLSARSSEFERQRADKLKQAADEAEAVRKSLTEKTRGEIEAERAAWKLEIDRDRSAAYAAIAHRTRDEVFETTGAALRDMAGVELEAAMAARFVASLRALEATRKTDLAARLAGTRPPIIIRSAFEMRAAERTNVETAVRAELGVTSPLTFLRSPELICGIELSADGHRISWTMAGYLAAIHDRTEAGLIQEHAANGR